MTSYQTWLARRRTDVERALAELDAGPHRPWKSPEQAFGPVIRYQEREWDLIVDAMLGATSDLDDLIFNF